jgi:hypothetical protein
MSDVGRWPTRKWLATQVTAAGGLVTAWLVAGAWNTTLSVAAVTLVVQALVGYLVPNLPTAGGVPGAPEPAGAGQPARTR